MKDMNTDMAIRHLAEAIILQSVEDLWDEMYRNECLRFFNSGGFDLCANIAGIGLSDRLILLRLIDGSKGKSIIPIIKDLIGGDFGYSIGRG